MLFYKKIVSKLVSQERVDEADTPHPAGDREGADEELSPL